MPLERRQALAGSLLLSMLALGVITELTALPRWPAGMCAWVALFLLMWELPRYQRTLCMVMATVGISAGMLAVFSDHTISARALATVNLDILMLLAGTSFLSMIVRAESNPRIQPRGRRAFATTLLGLHLFSATINIPAMLIAGDRMQREGRLHRLQEIVLSRAFSSAAFWSPFFAAMAVAISYAPGSELHVLVLYGLPPALAAQLVVLTITGRNPEIRDFEGYPVTLRALWVPVMLTLLVLILNALLPAAGIVPLIAAAAFLLSVGTAGSTARTSRHVREQLPRMIGELALFLAAGVLSRGFRVLVYALPAVPQPTELAMPIMALILLIMLTAARLGMHPIIAITMVATLLEDVAYDPNLVGSLYLTSWALGVAICPYSGTHLAMHARFGSSLQRLAQDNFGYAITVYLCTVTWWTLLTSLAG